MWVGLGAEVAVPEVARAVGLGVARALEAAAPVLVELVVEAADLVEQDPVVEQAARVAERVALEAGSVVVLVPAEPVRVLAAVQVPAGAQVVLAEVAGLGARAALAVEAVRQAEEALL